MEEGGISDEGGNLVKTGTPNPRIMQIALGAATAAGLGDGKCLD